jgi:hypothetical protein
VIGGLSAATIATLIFVPAVFALLHSLGKRGQTPQTTQMERHAVAGA